MTYLEPDPTEREQLRREALRHVPERTACRCGRHMQMAGAIVREEDYLVAVWRCGQHGCRRVRYAKIERATGEVVSADWATERPA